jgi:uncharacterized protein (TIGR02246 family)
MKFITIVFILLLTGTAFAQSDKDRAKAAAAIRSVMDTQAEAWNKGDIDAFMDGYWRSDKLIFVSGDKVTRGWQQTLDNYKKSYTSKERMGTLTFSDLEINVISKDAAVVLGSWSLERAGDHPHGKFTLTFRKMKEGWRIVIDHTS